MTLDQRWCESCGEDGEEQELFNPWIQVKQKVLMCTECFAYWSSEEGQASALDDAVENAERRAGWDASP